MESLITSFGDTSLGGGVKKLEGEYNVFISEVSSLSRLWIQSEVEGTEIDVMSEELQFYEKQGDGFSFNPSEVAVGMKVAAFAMNQWDRAEVIGYKKGSGNVRLFFMDYGTTGNLKLEFCRRLMEPFSLMSKKATRGALFGIQPTGNTRLWDISVISQFIDAIRNNVYRIKIMKYHSDQDFYEFLLYEADGTTFNRKLINSGLANPINKDGPLPLCLSYPPFEMLEKLDIYPTFGERQWVLGQYDVNLNEFEETFFPAGTNKHTFADILTDILCDPNYSNINDIFFKLFGN